MVDLTLYTARMTAYKDGTKDYEVTSMQDEIKYEFKSNPSYQQILYNSFYRDTHIVDNNKSFSKKVGEKKLLGYPNDVYSVGEYLTLFNKTWIILSKDEDSVVQEKCYISACNATLQIYDNNTYKLYPCMIEASTLSLGLDENNPFDVSDGVIRLTVKKDSITLTIIEGQRFIFGNKRAFKVTNINDFLNNTIIITLQRDAFNESTDKQVTISGNQYWIANYIETITPQPTSTEIIITPNTDIVKKSQASGVNFTAKLYVNGIETTDTFTFTVENTSTAIPSEYIFAITSGSVFNLKSLTMNKYVNIKAASTLSPTTQVVKKINLTLY